MRYDCAIIGSGPAGLEAALNLKIRNKNFILFGNSNLSTKIEKAPFIDNYLGLPHITGREMQKSFLNHLSQMEIDITTKQVTTLYPMGSYFAIATGDATYEATTVILTTGVLQGKLYPGEETFLGRGVGYCATCDAPLYKGKVVAVVGFFEHAVAEANFISTLAAKTYYIPARKTVGKLADNIEVLEGRITEIVGEKKVSSILIGDKPIPVDGVFILRETIAPTSLLPGIAVEDGFIIVDQNMRTAIPGCFAAGDCTGLPHQYIKAAGQGLIAGYSAVEFLDKAI